METASAAAWAIKSLCETCDKQMAPFLDALTQLYIQVQEAGVFGSTQQAFALDEEDVQQVTSFYTACISQRSSSLS